MKEKITVRDYFLEHIVENYDENYPIHSYINDPGFIFKQIRLRIHSLTTYPLLKAYLEYKHENVWAYNATILDDLFMQLYSQRYINSNIFNYSLNIKGEWLKWDVYNEELSKSIILRFGERWEQYLKELAIQYNPIHNYDMEEDEKVNTYLETSDDTDNYTNGFNSSTASPTDKSENTIIVDGDWDNNKRNLTRKGNIGVTTSQQMLEAEIKLRDENVFVERILKDVADFLTLSIY